MSNGYYRSEEWQQERMHILSQSDYTCKKCGSFTTSPHIHHPFGLASAVIEILCPDCHAGFHKRPSLANLSIKDRKCKYCTRPFVWKSEGEKWIPWDMQNNAPHECMPIDIKVNQEKHEKELTLDSPEYEYRFWRWLVNPTAENAKGLKTFHPDPNEIVLRLNKPPITWADLEKEWIAMEWKPIE